MSFFNRLFGRKPAEPVTPEIPAVAPIDAAAPAVPPAAAPVAAPAPQAPPQASPSASPSAADLEQDRTTTQILRDVAARIAEDGPADAAPGVWALDGEADGAGGQDGLPSTAQLLARAQQAPAGAKRSARVKTRLVGFDSSDGGETSLEAAFDAARAPAKAAEADAETTGPAAAEAGPAMFPTGWVLVVEGPGRGASFPVFDGMSSIGRGIGQTVRLDFGDAAISRENHAAIVYDAQARTFLLGHGGKSNIVRLNGTPVIANEALSDGDTIRISETTLRFHALCGPDFDWAETEGGDEDDDLAIA